jgi:hypothetical protein
MMMMMMMISYDIDDNVTVRGNHDKIKKKNNKNNTDKSYDNDNYHACTPGTRCPPKYLSAKLGITPRPAQPPPP